LSWPLWLPRLRLPQPRSGHAWSPPPPFPTRCRPRPWEHPSLRSRPPLRRLLLSAPPLLLLLARARASTLLRPSPARSPSSAGWACPLRMRRSLQPPSSGAHLPPAALLPSRPPLLPSRPPLISPDRAGVAVVAVGTVGGGVTSARLHLLLLLPVCPGTSPATLRFTQRPCSLVLLLSRRSGLHPPSLRPGLGRTLSAPWGRHRLSAQSGSLTRELLFTPLLMRASSLRSAPLNLLILLRSWLVMDLVFLSPQSVLLLVLFVFLRFSLLLR
jgi:hypothetical protein